MDRDGFCLVPQGLDEDMLRRVQSTAAKMVASLDEDHRQAQRSTGSMIDISELPDLAELVSNPRALLALEKLGFDDCKFWSGYFISKPPHSPRLFWHQDCIMWHDPRAYSDIPPMIFLMYYLTDTTRENGCLRVIPGTHRRRHRLYDLVGAAHTDDLRRVDDPGSPAYATFEDEVDVPVKAGDLVVGDARVFHASHANETDQERTVITLWYHPSFSELAESTQAWIQRQFTSGHGLWPEHAKKMIARVVPRYSGDAEPMVPDRRPGPQLK